MSVIFKRQTDKSLNGHFSTQSRLGSFPYRVNIVQTTICEPGKVEIDTYVYCVEKYTLFHITWTKDKPVKAFPVDNDVGHDADNFL